MPFTDLIGFIAAFLTTVAFIPQAWLVWRTRRADGISLGMYSIFTVGLLFWLGYGYLLMSWPIILANIITLILAAYILTMKLRQK